MANMEKDMSRNWNKIRAVVSECGVVDGKVVDLLVGLGKMPLSEAAEKVKEATGVVGVSLPKVKRYNVVSVRQAVGLYVLSAGLWSRGGPLSSLSSSLLPLLVALSLPGSNR